MKTKSDKTLEAVFERDKKELALKVANDMQDGTSVLEGGGGMTYQKLRAYLFNQYKLTLTQDTSLDELCRMVDETRMEGQGVQWILVNALRHLDDDELNTLAEAIAKRIGPK